MTIVQIASRKNGILINTKNQNTKKYGNSDMYCYDKSCLLNSINQCYICKEYMCLSHSKYISKNSDGPIICTSCMCNPEHNELIGSYIIHFGSRTTLYQRYMKKFIECITLLWRRKNTGITQK